MHSRSFTQYIADAKRGDQSAAEYIVSEFGSLVRLEVINLVPNSPDMSVRDSVQEVWLKVWQRISTFRGAESSKDCRILFKAWLMFVARNAAIDILQKANTQKRGGGLQRNLLPDVPGREKTPSSYANGRSQAERLRDVMNQMDSVDAETLRLRFYERLKVREIAERLELSIDQVRTGLDRGMKQLSREIDE